MPQTVTAAEPQFGWWLHEAFLAHAAEPGNQEGRHALGGFLTLRLADRFDPAEEAAHPLALAYQVRATRDYLTDLEPQNVEANHLLQIVRMADAVQQGGSRAILWPPLLSYANWLEQELRLSEALDVVETALRLTDGRAPAEEIAALLQRARILRLLGHLDDATGSYEAARVKAVATGDTHSQLLGRIGQAIVMRQQGNLSGSEKKLHVILKDAEVLRDRDAQARTHHDLGAATVLQGRLPGGLVHHFRAFELYARPADKLRALLDVGDTLARLGAHEAAEDAYALVLTRNPSLQQRAVAMEQMLELSGVTRNRVAFQHWNRELRRLEDHLPVLLLGDYELALGNGYHLFGQHAKAKEHLQRAVQIAEENGLNELVFKAEDALKGARQRPEEGRHVAAQTSSGEWEGHVSAVAEKLHALRCA